MASRILSVVFAVAMLAVVVAGVARVADVEEQELFVYERATIAQLSERPDATADSVRLASAQLAADQWVEVELCAADRMPVERWAGAMAVAVWRPRGRELLVRTDLGAEQLAGVRRNSREGCLPIGSGRIENAGEYAVEAFWERPPTAVETVPLTLTIQARRPLATVDRVLVGLGWLAALGLVAALALPRRRASAEPDEWEREQEAARRPLIPEARLGLGILLLVGVFLASSLIPAGAAIALGAAVGMAVLECAIALGLAPGLGLRRKVDALALSGPRLPWLWFPGALLVGVALRYVARYSTMLVPSTGESPVQSFVRWPSGLLSFACLAVVVPLAEEVFFRGFVYGALAERSRALALIGTTLLFVLAHAPQTWGQWGALVALAVTSVSLTALRAASGSTLVAALAHLVYNGLLALGAVLAR